MSPSCLVAVPVLSPPEPPEAICLCVLSPCFTVLQRVLLEIAGHTRENSFAYRLVVTALGARHLSVAFWWQEAARPLNNGSPTSVKGGGGWTSICVIVWRWLWVMLSRVHGSRVSPAPPPSLVFVVSTLQAVLVVPVVHNVHHKAVLPHVPAGAYRHVPAPLVQ